MKQEPPRQWAWTLVGDAARELRDELLGSGVQVELRARLAELPTITAVGMNALSPIERDGRLTPLVKLRPRGRGE